MINSPLRYPGGKAKLFPFISRVLIENKLVGTHYCEPYAGGAGLAIRLLACGLVNRISINDIDPSIYAFWVSALNDTEAFCSLIRSTPITIDEWYRQREIWQRGNSISLLDLGFSAFYLNRTNRSGIIDGAGPIGGYSQVGKWKIDVRLVREKQIQNLQSLAKFGRQISITSLDASDFIEENIRNDASIIYADPPYYVKGSKLYRNFYIDRDHQNISQIFSSNRGRNWIVSYDDVPRIRGIYSDFEPVSYQLNYSAGTKNLGSEVIFLSDALTMPEFEGFARAA